MTKIYLIRHGQRLDLRGDPTLSEEGGIEAFQTGQFLVSEGISAVFSSTLVRAKETARIIAEILGLKVVHSPLLVERFNWGDVPGQSREQFLKSWYYSEEHRDWQPPSGDSAVDCGNRLRRVIEQVEKDYKNKNVVIVAHAGIISDFLQNTFDPSVLNALGKLFLIMKADYIPECSITEVEVDKGEYFLKTLASTGHLRTDVGTEGFEPPTSTM